MFSLTDFSLAQKYGICYDEFHLMWQVTYSQVVYPSECNMERARIFLKTLSEKIYII